MRTETIIKTYYQFDELEPEAQEKAIEKLYYINVDHEWGEFVYWDAENIGLKITGFDISRRNDITGELTDYTLSVAERILKEHGQNTDTYKLAEQYIKDRKELTTKIMTSNCQDDADLLCEAGEKEWETVLEYIPAEPDEDDYEDLNIEFERALKEEYLSILRKEYDYLTSEEAIIETIRANEYEFDEEGNLQ